MTLYALLITREDIENLRNHGWKHDDKNLKRASVAYFVRAGLFRTSQDLLINIKKAALRRIDGSDSTISEYENSNFLFLVELIIFDWLIFLVELQAVLWEVVSGNNAESLFVFWTSTCPRKVTKCQTNHNSHPKMTLFIHVKYYDNH